MTDFLSQLVRRSETEAVAREKKHQQELREREEAEAAAAEAKRQQELRQRKEADAAAEAKRQQELRERKEAEAGAEAKRQELRQREEAEAVAAEAKRQQELRQRKAAEAAAAEAKRQQELRQREEAEAAAAAEARRQQLRARQRLIYFATVVLLCLTSVGAFLHWGTLGPRDNSLSVPPLSSVEDKAKPSVPPRHEPATYSKPANTQVGPSAATGPHSSLEAPPGGTAPQQPTSNDGLNAQTPPPNATPLVAPPPAVPSALAEAPALGLPEAQQSDPVPTERTSPSTFLAPPQQAAEQPQLALNAPVAKPSPKTSPPHAPFGRMATNDPGARKPDASETKLKTAAIENNVDSAMRRLRQDRPGRAEPPSPPLQELSVPLPPYPVTSSSAVGLLCRSVTKETAGGLGLEAPQGMVVTGVVVGSPADRAGLRENDVISRSAVQKRTSFLY